MMARYFKATDGVLTVFRASGTRTYASAWFTRYPGETRPSGEIGFSGKSGYFPTTEITKAEYEALQAAKVRRIEAGGGSITYASPSHSWVRNAELESAP